MFTISSHSNGSKEKNTPDSKRIFYLDILRIIACFFVIFNHTGSRGFFMFSQRPQNSLSYWCYLFISVFCKFSVPVFFAISGTVLLGKDEDYKTIIKKRVIPIAMSLFFISAMYYAVNLNFNMRNFSVSKFFLLLYQGKISIPLWYLYAYLAFLISLPFLRKMVVNLEDYHYRILFMFVILFDGIIPCIEYAVLKNTSVMTSNLKPQLLLQNIVCYPCIGYYLSCKKMKGTDLLLIWLFNILCIVWSGFMTHYKGMVTGILIEGQSQSFHSCFVMVNCVAMFSTAKYISEHTKTSELAQRITVKLASYTFGIYLFHSLVNKRHGLQPLLSTLQSTPLNDMVATFLYCFIVMCVSGGITFILSKLPGVKKLVGF